MCKYNSNAILKGTIDFLITRLQHCPTVVFSYSQPNSQLKFIYKYLALFDVDAYRFTVVKFWVVWEILNLLKAILKKERNATSSNQVPS